MAITPIEVWKNQKIDNIGNYALPAPEQKENESNNLEKQKTANERVYKILGPEGYQKLHGKPYRPEFEPDKTEARKQFIEAISACFGENFLRENKIDKDQTALSTLSKIAQEKGYDLKKLYEKAIQEERESQAYKNAVFLKSIEVYEDGNFGDQQKVILIAGPSGSGKTSVRPDIVQTLTKGTLNPNADPENLTSNQHLVVTVDGGLEREVSQIRDLMNETSLKLGYGGIDDLEEVTTHATKGSKLKKSIETAANHNNFHLAIPTTHPTKELEHYMKKAKADVYYVSVENTAEVVSYISRLRAFAKKGTTIPLGGNYKKPESKKPGKAGSFTLGTLLAHFGAYEYAKKQRKLKKDPVILQVTKNLILVKPKRDSTGVAHEFIPCTENDPDSVLMTVQQLQAWPEASKAGINIEHWPLKKPTEVQKANAAYVATYKDQANQKPPTKEQIYHALYVEQYEKHKSLAKETITVASNSQMVTDIASLQTQQAQVLAASLKDGKLSEKNARLHLRILRFHTGTTFQDLLSIFENPPREKNWPYSKSAAMLMITLLEKQDAILSDPKTTEEARKQIIIEIAQLKQLIFKQKDKSNINMNNVLQRIDIILANANEDEYISLPPPIPAPVSQPREQKVDAQPTPLTGQKKTYSLTLPTSVEQFDMPDAKRKLYKVDFNTLLRSVNRNTKYYFTDEQGKQQRFFFKTSDPDQNMKEPEIANLTMEEFIPKLYEYLTGKKLTSETLAQLPTLIQQNKIGELFKNIEPPSALIALSEICDIAAYTAAGEETLMQSIFFTENNSTTNYTGGSKRDTEGSMIITKSPNGFKGEYSGSVLSIAEGVESTTILERSKDGPVKTSDTLKLADNYIPSTSLFTIKASAEVRTNPDTGFVELTKQSSLENIPKDKKLQIVIDAKKRNKLLEKIEQAKQPSWLSSLFERAKNTFSKSAEATSSPPSVQPGPSTHATATPRQSHIPLEPHSATFPPNPETHISGDNLKPTTPVLLDASRAQTINNDKDMLGHAHLVVSQQMPAHNNKVELLAITGKDPVHAVNSYTELQGTSYILEISGNRPETEIEKFAIEQLLACKENTTISGIKINNKSEPEKFANWVEKVKELKKQLSSTSTVKDTTQPPHFKHT